MGSMAERQPFREPGSLNRVSFALGAFALQVVLLAVGAFKGDDDNAWRYFLITAVIAAIVTGIVFWGIVPRIDTARSALILAIVGAVAIVLFWLGLPVVIAAGAIYVALKARGDDRSTAANAALAIGVVTIALAGIVAFIG
jgi:hypothetical protein